MRDQVRGPFYPVRDIEIEAYLCGELHGAARGRLEAELERNAKLKAYVEDRRREQASFLARHPFTLQLPATASQRRDGSVIWGGLLAAVALLALILPGRSRVEPELTPWPYAERDTVRVKGNTLSADLFVKRGETVFRYRPGTALRAGDRVRISIESPSSGYLSVFGRDARGQVSVYYSALLTTSGRYTVPDSLILDDADGDEQWVLVHAADMQPIDRYVDAFTHGRDLNAPHAVIQLHKETP